MRDKVKRKKIDLRPKQFIWIHRPSLPTEWAEATLRTRRKPTGENGTHSGLRRCGGRAPPQKKGDEEGGQGAEGHANHRREGGRDLVAGGERVAEGDGHVRFFYSKGGVQFLRDSQAKSFKQNKIMTEEGRIIWYIRRRFHSTTHTDAMIRQRFLSRKMLDFGGMRSGKIN